MPPHDQHWSKALFKNDLQFPSFSRLPQELQDTIWIYSLPGPRLIEFRPRVFINNVLTPEHGERPAGPPSVGSVTGDRYTLCVARAPAPVTLHACSNSRVIAKRYYTLSFARELYRPIYFDHARDRILFAGLWGLRYFLERTNAAIVKSLEYVVLDPLNIVTRQLEPVCFPGAGRPVALVRLTPMYGHLKRFIVLEPDPSHVRIPTVDIASSARTRLGILQSIVDRCAGIVLRSFSELDRNPSDAVTRMSGGSIVESHMHELQRWSLRYRRTRRDEDEPLEVWENPAFGEETVAKLLEDMSENAKTLAKKWEDGSCEVVILKA